ncbi:MAG TPA: DUF3558 domain-containing protein [Mycobacterium sp.]
MVTRMRLTTVLGALVTAVILILQQTPSTVSGGDRLELRSTSVPLNGPSTSKDWAPKLTNPHPFVPCEDIPDEAIERLGLAFTPPNPAESMRCEYDAGNYQMAIEPIIWRSYAESLPADALETDIDGHRAAWFWVMKPTEWNNRWWHTCMVVFKTSYGVIQQSLYYSPIYSNPRVDCPTENMMRAHQLAPYYKF